MQIIVFQQVEAGGRVHDNCLYSGSMTFDPVNVRQGDGWMSMYVFVLHDFSLWERKLTQMVFPSSYILRFSQQ